MSAKIVQVIDSDPGNGFTVLLEDGRWFNVFTVKGAWQWDELPQPPTRDKREPSVREKVLLPHIFHAGKSGMTYDEWCEAPADIEGTATMLQALLMDAPGYDIGTEPETIEAQLVRAKAIERAYQDGIRFAVGALRNASGHHTIPARMRDALAEFAQAIEREGKLSSAPAR